MLSVEKAERAREQERDKVVKERGANEYMAMQAMQELKTYHGTVGNVESRNVARGRGLA